MSKLFKMKALGSALLFLLLCGSVIGCADREKVNSDIKNLEEKVPMGELKTKKEQVSLRMLSWEKCAQSENERLIKSFEEKNPSIKVSIDYVTDSNSLEYLNKVDIYLMSGDKIDIVVWPGIQDAYQRIYKNLFEPLDDYFKAENKTYEDTYNIGIKNKDKIYALPGDEKIWFVMINKNMLDEAGLPVPPMDWTWDDYRRYAKKLTKGIGETKVYGSYMHNWDTLANLAVYSSKIGSPFWKNETVHNLDDPNLKDWLKFKYELENEDNSQMKYFDVKSGKVSYRDMFFDGKTAMLPIGSWMIGEMKDVGKYGHNFITTFAALPRWKDAPEGRTVADSLFYCISVNSENKKQAYDFIRYYTTDGQYLKNMGLSAQRGADNSVIINEMVKGVENYYDISSLKAVLNNPKRFDNVFDIVPKADSVVKDIFIEEYEKYMVGDQKLENAMENMKTRADEAVNASKQ